VVDVNLSNWPDLAELTWPELTWPELANELRPGESKCEKSSVYPLSIYYSVNPQSGKDCPTQRLV
jgi:hypothetical protein